MLIVFDAFGTLFDTGTTIELCEGLAPGQGERIAARWRELQLQHSWQRALMRAYRDFAAITREALEGACEEAGVRAEAEALDRVAGGYADLRPYADTVPTIRALRGARLAVLSNGTQEQLRRLVAGAGLSGDLALLSADAVRTYKPDPRVYDLVTRRFAVAPAQTAFVSSNAWDVAGAMRFGFDAIWLNRAGAPFTAAGPRPAREVASLTELSVG